MKDEYYFGIEQEKAIFEYLAEPDIDKRNKIFNEKLYKQLVKLFYGVIGKNAIYSSLNYSDKHILIKELENETLIYMIGKFPNLKKTDSTDSTISAAYSYFSFIAKNFIFDFIRKENKISNNQYSIDDLNIDIEDKIYSDDIDINVLYINSKNNLIKTTDSNITNEEKVNNAISIILNDSNKIKDILNEDDDEFWLQMQELTGLKLIDIYKEIIFLRKKYNNFKLTCDVETNN